jgi:hypothetical protein
MLRAGTDRLRIHSSALLEQCQQVHFGVPARDLNQRRMGGDNAKYLTGAE